MVAIEDGTNMRKAVDKFHIPHSSLCKWCYGMRTLQKQVRPIVLISTEEQQIIYYMLTIDKLDYGLNQTTLKMKVYKIIKGRWMLNY